ncbi:flagellar protein FlaG [Anaerosolibacter sp.]|uniref:flagellar protein FlaG n=1 Tax=Anaerosolibacter sp. TaxID=1872527 RepID=UPI0039EE0B59
MKIEGSTIVNTLGPSLINQENIQNRNALGESTEAETIQEPKVNFPGEKQLIEIIEKSNQDLQMQNTSLKFSIHEKTKQILVKLVDNDTKEVVREIPPEKILDMVAAMLERTGLFVDKKA